MSKPKLPPPLPANKSAGAMSSVPIPAKPLDTINSAQRGMERTQWLFWGALALCCTGVMTLIVTVALVVVVKLNSEETLASSEVLKSLDRTNPIEDPKTAPDNDAASSFSTSNLMAEAKDQVSETASTPAPDLSEDSVADPSNPFQPVQSNEDFGTPSAKQIADADKINDPVATILAERLFDGEFRVEVAHTLNGSLGSQDQGAIRYSFSLNGKAQPFEDQTVAIPREANPLLKRLFVVTVRSELRFELSTGDEKHTNAAKEFKKAWAEAGRLTNQWNQLVSKVPDRTLQIEKQIAKSELPESYAECSALVSRLKDSAAQVQQKIASEKANFVQRERSQFNRNAEALANANFSVYESGIQKLLDEYEGLLMVLNSFSSNEVFDSGVVLYYGEAKNGELVAPTPLQFRYRIGH